MINRFLILLLFFSTTACGVKQAFTGMIGDEDNTEPPSELTEFVATADVTRVWSEDVGKGSGELFIKLVPVLLGDSIYTSDTEGRVEAINTESGQVIWKNSLDLPVTGGPGADVDLILLGSSEGDVIALANATGDEVWRVKVSSEILSSPRESEGVVIVRTIDGKIFALDALSGERLWIYDRTVPSLTLRGTGTPVIANGVVIAGFDGGRVTALELKTGKLLWEQRVAISSGRSELERMVDVDAQPLIMDDVIYINSFQANVSALALQSGVILWQREISSYTELGADDSNLYITNSDGHVWALDRFSGSSVWKQEALHARQVTGPTVIGDKVVVGDLEGYLHWLDKTAGDFTARVQVSDEPIITSAITNNDKLFAYASDGTLSAYVQTNNGVVVQKSSPEQEVSAEQVIESASTEIPKAKESEEEEGSFFGRFLEVFTGGEENENY